jgi:hypothetical protein
MLGLVVTMLSMWVHFWFKMPYRMIWAGWCIGSGYVDALCVAFYGVEYAPEDDFMMRIDKGTCCASLT